MPPERRVLVTGANGFIGRALVAHLKGAGDWVRGWMRRPGALGADGLLADGTLDDVCLGDVGDPTKFAPALEGIDLVFHLAGTRRAVREDDYFRTNARATAELARAASTLPNPPRFVFMSSIAAVGPTTPNHPHSERVVHRPVEPYGASKAAAERSLWALPRLPWTILRPVRVFGPGDRDNLVFARLVDRGVHLQLEGPDRPVSVVDLTDVVDALLRVAAAGNTLHRSYFVTAQPALSLAAIQTIVARTLARSTRPLVVPTVVLDAAGRLGDRLSGLLQRPLPVNGKLVAQLLAAAWECDPSALTRDVGWVARIGPEASVARAAAWYRDHGQLPHTGAVSGSTRD